MPDRDLQHLRHVRQEVTQVVLRQVMAGIHAKPHGLRATRGRGEQRQHRCGVACGVRFGIGSGVQLDAIGADLGRLFQQRVAGIDEQADPAAHRLQLGHQRTQALAVALEVETVVGGDLAIAVRHQGGLRRTRLRAQRQQPRVAVAWRCEGIAFDVEFDASDAGQRGQRQHVLGGDVASIRSRMHGDAMRSGIQAGLGGTHHIGFGTTARVAQDGDLVDVDTELGHRTVLLGKRGRIVFVALIRATGLGLLTQAAQFVGIDQG